MTSLAISPLTMPAALAAADQVLDHPVWVGDPSNSDQMAWLESFRRRAGLAHTMPEIRCNATESIEYHIAWLQAEGWDAQITSAPTQSNLFLAATIDIRALWKEAGRAYKDGAVDRVVLQKGASVTYTLSSSRYDSIVSVDTQAPGISFLFRQLERRPPATELAAYAKAMVSEVDYWKGKDSPFPEVHLDFPMVDLKVSADARYMIGLRSGENVVTQAAEQLRLELNEFGGRASAAAEIAVSRGSRMPPVIKIDGPFMVVMTRANPDGYFERGEDLDEVVFAAYVDRDSWRKPAGRI
jgi:hypothetical protein